MSSRKRIMVLEVNPLVPQEREYATMDPAWKGSGVSLSGGNLIVTSTSSTSFGRIRSTIPLVSGQYYWEVKQTSLGTAGYVSSPGMIDETSPLNTGAFGFDGYLTAGCPYTFSGNAWVYFNSALISSLGAWVVNTVVRNWYDADRGIYKIAINGGSWITVFDRVEGSSIVYYVGCAVARLAVFQYNFGASAFDYAVPSTSRAGVYLDEDPVATKFYLSSSKLNTESGDTPPLVNYMARISKKRDLETSRIASCYPWSEKAKSSRGSVLLVNNDGALDGWEDFIWTDTEATVFAGYEGDSISAFVEQSNEIVRDYDSSEGFFQLDFLDPLAKLDSAVPRFMYGTANANPAEIGNPYPKVFGQPQYCSGVFRTTAITGNDAYSLDYTDTTDVVNVITAYDKGDLFDHTPTGGHRDFYMLQNGIGMKLPNVPAGTVTCHPIGPFQYDDTSTDRISGGAPFTGWGTYPTGWSLYGTAWNVTNKFQDGAPFGGSTGSARMRVSGSQTVGMLNSATSIGAGKIVIEFTVEVMTTPGYICFLLGTTYQFVRVDRVGAFRTAMDNPSTAQLVMLGGLVGSYSLGATDFIFSGLHAYDAVVPEYLPEWLDLFVAQYGGLTVDTAGVSALVADANWRLAHFSDKEETIKSILDTTMHGWLGSLIPKRNGQISVFSLSEPSATPDFTFDKSRIRSVDVETDAAPGLTTRLAGKRNYTPTDITQIASGASATVRSELQKEFLIIRSGEPSNEKLGGGLVDAAELVVSTSVRHADGSPPQETFLQEADHIQVQASKATTLFKVQRKKYVVTLVLDAVIADLLETNMTIEIIYDRHQLDAGKNLRLYGLKTFFWSNIVTLYLWG